MTAPSIDFERRSATVQLLARSAGKARVLMTGASMHPLLRAGMVLDVKAFDPNAARVGDVVVFRQGDRLVAHRLVERSSDTQLRCCGDAQPASPEFVPLADVIGVVDAVYASDAPNAVRIDDASFRRHGVRLARDRRRRAATLRLRWFGARIVRRLGRGLGRAKAAGS
jgi:hypothetical protein